MRFSGRPAHLIVEAGDSGTWVDTFPAGPQTGRGMADDISPRNYCERERTRAEALRERALALCGLALQATDEARTIRARSARVRDAAARLRVAISATRDRRLVDGG